MLRVVKVGGSLLGLSDLPDLLRRLATTGLAGARTVWLIGGGTAVDAFRDLHRAHALDEVTSHAAAVRVLDATATVLMTLLDRAGRRPEPVFDHRLPLLNDAVLFPTAWTLNVEPNLPGEPLPRTWDTTSDAIAARYALVCGASELVFVKRISPPGPTVASAAAAGALDPIAAHLLLKAAIPAIPQPCITWAWPYNGRLCSASIPP